MLQLFSSIFEHAAVGRDDLEQFPTFTPASLLRDLYGRTL